MQFESRLYSLKDIVEQSEEWKFVIPIYQRLYVWGEDQVLTLLNDLVNAYEREEDLFFLGGALVVEQSQSHGRLFELIDGQQRFATLWMLCHAWKNALEPFLTVKEGDRVRPRIRFAIRPEVNMFLNSLIFENAGADDPQAKPTESMREAIGTMVSLFERRSIPEGVTKENYLVGLSRFVFSQVKLVLTTVPPQTDLNKLFEVINNRGVQLQHHEILKARMLDALDGDDRHCYAILWDSCADMENFVERSLAGNSHILAKDVAVLYEKEAARGDGEMLAKATSVLEALKGGAAVGGAGKDPRRLDEILARMPKDDAPGNAPPSDDDNVSWVRGMFGFPMFLQHTLRIWLHRRSRRDLPRILDRELLALFEEHFFSEGGESGRTDRVKEFIQLLWELRYIFDKHFIKWVDRGEEEVHMISRLSLSESGESRHLSRSRETEVHKGFGLLQSMLYHSQEITTHYWVTPVLSYIHQHPGSPDAHYCYLRHLEANLLGGDAEGSLIERTHVFMDNPWARYSPSHRSELIQAEGVNFRHYWFFKLEFVLWCLGESENIKWKKFRFTAKNSVEHISPQAPVKQDDNRVETMLHHFGNLALVSRSLNSEYSNLPFNEKRQRFLNNNKQKVDSLKMDLIYRSETWDDAIAREHQDAMIGRFDEYWQRHLQPCVTMPASDDRS